MAVSDTTTSHLAPGPVCGVCPLFEGCRRICEPVSLLLPSMEKGRVDPEDLPRLFAGVRETNAILDHIGLLTPRQQEVVRLYYREALLQHEIAAVLKVSQQAVNDSLQRARQTIGSALRGMSRSRVRQLPRRPASD